MLQIYQTLFLKWFLDFRSSFQSPSPIQDFKLFAQISSATFMFSYFLMFKALIHLEAIYNIQCKIYIRGYIFPYDFPVIPKVHLQFTDLRVLFNTILNSHMYLVSAYVSSQHHCFAYIFIHTFHSDILSRLYNIF